MKVSSRQWSVVIIPLSAMLFALVFTAEAQQSAKKFARIGVLRNDSPATFASRNEAFRQGLSDLGYVEGKNIQIEYRYAETKLDRLPRLATELVHLKVDVIVVGGAGRPEPPNRPRVRPQLSWEAPEILSEPGWLPVSRNRVEISRDRPTFHRT